MKREYSFNEISRITMGAPDNENKPPSQPYYTANKPRDSWTDMRVEQIKKKYDTPSHRKNYSHYGNNQRSRQIQPEIQINNPYSSYRNPLKDSITSQNIIKKDSKMGTVTSNYKDEISYKNNWDDTQYVPRFSCGSKQNQNFMQKFSQIKNSMKVTQSRPTPTRQNREVRQTRQNCKSREYPTNNINKIDPRVQNIDKINMKIKKILDCLNENQKHPKVQQRMQLKNSFMKGSVISKDNQSEQMEQTKIISRQKIGYQRQTTKYNMKSSITSNDRYPITHTFQPRTDSNSKWKFEDKYNYPAKNNQSYIDNTQQVKKIQKQKQKVQDQTDSWFQPSKKNQNKRSRSCLGNFVEEDIKLNSGKKLDDQISKINVRIRQFQEQKKKLNIQFKPYNYQLKYNRSTSNLGDHKSQRSLKPPLPKQITKVNQVSQQQPYSQIRHQYQEKVKTQTSQYVNRSSMDTKKQTYEYVPRYTLDSKASKPSYEYDYKPMNRISSINNLAVNENVNNNKYQDKRRQTPTQSFTRYEQKYRQKSATPEFQQKYESNKQVEITSNNKQQDNAYSNELKLKTEQGIEQRKRKLLETATVSFSRQTKRLITNLFEQVKLDQQLRNAKIWFRDLMSNNKWNQIKQQAQKLGIDFQRQQFQISEQEDNPFYSVRQSSQSVKFLLEKWMIAQKYWEDNIFRQFNLKQFEVQKFTSDKVDLQKKGYFVVEDLVRFLNMETGTFYRNRDLILVFRRLANSDKLLWEEFLAKLDQSQ